VRRTLERKAQEIRARFQFDGVLKSVGVDVGSSCGSGRVTKDAPFVMN
jgi:hypothetical protein